MRFLCSGRVASDACCDEARLHPNPPHEHGSRKGPPHPDPLLHKCVEEREMKRCARVLRINVRNSSGNSFHDDASRREPHLPGLFLHKCMEEREMERRARVLRINVRNSSGNSLPRAGGQIDAAQGESNQIQPNPTRGWGVAGGCWGGWQRNTAWSGAGDLIQEVGWGWTKDSVGGTPMGAVETTALPNSNRIKANQTGGVKFNFQSSKFKARSDPVKASQTSQISRDWRL